MQSAAPASSWVEIEAFRERFAISRTNGSFATLAKAAFRAKRPAITAPTEINPVLRNFLRPSLVSGMVLPLFFLVGVIYDRAHTRDLDKFGGLGVKMPVYAGMLTVFSLASLGLPGLSGFISEFMSLMGSYAAFKVITIISVLGIVITAGYFLYMLQRVLMGPLNEKLAAISDINKRELFTLIPLMAIAILIGVYPLAALKFQMAAIEQLIQNLGGMIF